MSITNRVLIECTRALCTAIESTNDDHDSRPNISDFESALADAMLADSLIEVTTAPANPKPATPHLDDAVFPKGTCHTSPPTTKTKTLIGLLDKMPMGKHRALSLAEVYDKYPDYMSWVKENVSNWTFADEPDFNAYARKAASKSKSKRTKQQKQEDKLEDEHERIRQEELDQRGADEDVPF